MCERIRGLVIFLVFLNWDLVFWFWEKSVIIGSSRKKSEGYLKDIKDNVLIVMKILIFIFINVKFLF